MPDEGRFYAPSRSGALRQCELVSSLVEVRAASTSGQQDNPTVDLVTHPFALVLSQDCDLEIDFLARNHPESLSTPKEKLLPGVLFCELVAASELKGRLSDGQIWRQIRENKNERYAYLRSGPPELDALKEGFPDLGMDFKRYFTVPTNVVYEQLSNKAARRACLESPYLEHLSTRFANYLSRIALPEEHHRG